MKKVWYILINKKEKGPFTLEDLILNKQFTAETLTRKEGTHNWRPAKEIPEFEELFDDHSNEETHEPEKEPEKKEISLQDDEIALDWSKRPIDPMLIFLILILLASLTAFMIYELNS